MLLDVWETSDFFFSFLLYILRYIAVINCKALKKKITFMTRIHTWGKTNLLEIFPYLVDWKSNNLFDKNVNVHACPLRIDEIFQVGIIFIGNSYDMRMGLEHLIFTWVGNNIVQGWRSPWITTDTCYRLLWSGQNDKMPCAGRPTDNLWPS